MPEMRCVILLLALVALPARAPGDTAETGVTAPGPAGGSPSVEAPAPALAALIARADAAYARRDEPGALDEVRRALEEAARLAPADYDVLWRQSRLEFWLADDPGARDEDKSRLGKRGWELGERAIAAAPDRVEGYHYAAAGMGYYGLGIGVFKALRMGLEGKLKDRFSRAERIDPAFEDGAIQTAWGRFWFKLPWPKYDAVKSERALLEALRRNPDNVRARVYLAELYRKEGHAREATEQLRRAMAAPPGRYDAPEERRWQRVAQEMLDHPR
jgi:tetratricopeptide (TPR) repeat protein